MSGGDYVLIAASMILFWGLMISGIVLLVRCLGTNGSPVSSRQQSGPPEAVLAERFARGEIDEEYRRRLDTLRDHDQVRTARR